MPSQAPYRSEAFAEDLGEGRHEPAMPPRVSSRVLWPLVLALAAATVLTLFAPAV